MKKVLEEILWRIYYASNERMGRRRDIRFFAVNKIIEGIHNYTEKQLYKALNDLDKSGLVKNKKDYAGSVLVSLTEKGILRAISYKFRLFNYRKEKWDGKWRMITFDIPRECEKGRKALVYRLKTGGFYRLQDSIFLYPYDCQNELGILVDLFKLKKYMRFGLLDSIDNEEKVKLHFNIK